MASHCYGKHDPAKRTNELSKANTLTTACKHFDRWMFGKFQDMAIKPHTYGLLFGLCSRSLCCCFRRWLLFTSPGLSFGKRIVSAYTNHFLQWPHPLASRYCSSSAAVFALALAVRYFVVEYVGDVAIYVSSYKVSRFDEIRNKILEEASSVARQIYSAGVSDTTQLPYDSLLVI